MAKLRDLARLIRSKNAGPFELTFDIMFESSDVYEQVKASGVITADLFGRLYGIPVDSVRVYAYDPAYAYKITVPRPIISGSLGDSDVHGGQQFGPLVDVEIPLNAAGAPNRLPNHA